MTAQQPAIIMTKRGIAIHMNGKQHSITDSHRNYERIKEAIRNQEWDRLPQLVNIAEQVQNFGRGAVTVKDGEVLYKGMPLHNSLTRRLLRMMDEGFDIEPMRLFLENLMENPSHRAVNELYDFLEDCELPITPDGYFLAYKNVRDNFTDIYSGKFDNSVGAVPEMPRNMVDEDKDRTCSKGLHFCSIGYLSFYGAGPGNVTVIVKVNPRDVVSIPADHNNQRGRACRYEVVGVHEGRGEREAFNQAVHNIGGEDDSVVPEKTYEDKDPQFEGLDRLRDTLKPYAPLNYKHKRTGNWNRMPPTEHIRDNDVYMFLTPELSVNLSVREIRSALANEPYLSIVDENEDMVTIEFDNFRYVVKALQGPDTSAQLRGWMDQVNDTGPAPSASGNEYKGQPRDPATGRFLSKARKKIFGR